MSELHKKYKTMKSSNLAKHFTEDNGKYWKEYHELVQQNEKTYQEDKIPVNQVIQYLESKKNKRIKSKRVAMASRPMIPTTFPFKVSTSTLSEGIPSPVAERQFKKQNIIL